MEALPVQRLIGIPDAMHAHETGKRWIPFYFGTDARRMITFYKGEGCLTFTGGSDTSTTGNNRMDNLVIQGTLIPTPGASAPVRAIPAAQAAVTDPGAGSPTPTPPSAAKPLPAEKVAPRTAAEAPVTTPIEKPTRDPAKAAAMGFPVDGKIIRAYSKGKNDGIDIAGSPGAPVKAAADGSVAAITSSADQVPIVVVRHADNLLTVYANVDNIKVKKGDSIKRGQTLAALRGGDNAYVHFEVRNGFDSVNPVPYLE